MISVSVKSLYTCTFTETLQEFEKNYIRSYNYMIGFICLPLKIYGNVFNLKATRENLFNSLKSVQKFQEQNQQINAK